MLPKPPPRDQSLGFLYLPPYRVIGHSVAGETTTVQIPELDLTFDMGSCPRPMLASKFVAISHGHMDHIGGLAYYCSQRNFQGMGPGTIICPAELENPIHKMMAGFVDLERQKTPYNLIAIKNDEPVEIKNNIFITAFPLEHTGPTFGFSVHEKRSKLLAEYVGLPQEKLMELKSRGTEITRSMTIPICAYVMDTAPCPNLIREDVRKAQILITECTFFEADNKERAKSGMHMHVDELCQWLKVVECEHIVLGHISRRTNLMVARKEIGAKLGRDVTRRIELLMDSKSNKERYERQLLDAGEHPQQVGPGMRRPMGGDRGPAPGGYSGGSHSGGGHSSGGGQSSGGYSGPSPSTGQGGYSPRPGGYGPRPSYDSRSSRSGPGPGPRAPTAPTDDADENRP